MKLSLFPLLVLVAISSVACAGPRAVAGPDTPPVVATPKKPLREEALKKFNEALTLFVQHDEAHDWTPGASGTCTQVAAMFDEATGMQAGVFAHATFNAGMAHQRCGDDAQARTHFEKAAKDDPGFHAAEAKLALYRFKEDANATAAIEGLQRAVAEGKFSDVAALVDLAAMQMARDASTPAANCKDDMDCAKLNLHRALALDDAYMPAHNELALYYFQLARKRAAASGAGAQATTSRRGLSRSVLTPSSTQKRGDVQQLELAALVCSQAIAKNSKYAPIHNTLGLIHYELGHVNSAVSEFGRAAELDPKFFEAQMNLAAVNLGFRGFEQAQVAYKRALAVRPNDYDAHLGMAVALRGPIVDEGDANAHRAKIAAVDAEIAAAKRIDQNRPDAFYNEAIFVHEFKSTRETPTESIAALEQAEASFKTFIAKAQGKPEYDAAVTRANERLKDIATTKTFLASSAAPATPAAAPTSPTKPTPTPTP